jgi:hypothetical protein
MLIWLKFLFFHPLFCPNKWADFISTIRIYLTMRIPLPLFAGAAEQIHQKQSHFALPNASNPVSLYSLTEDKASFSKVKQPHFSGFNHAKSLGIIHYRKEMNKANATPSNIVYVWDNNANKGIPFRVDGRTEVLAREIMGSAETPSGKTSRLKSILLKAPYGYFGQKLEAAVKARASESTVESSTKPEPKASSKVKKSVFADDIQTHYDSEGGPEW